MILVIMGTERFPFDRLAREVDELAASGRFGDEDLFVQLGSCTHEPAACKWERRVEFQRMRELVGEARLVIAHAGAGTFMLCRELDTPQIVVPRRKAFGEHVDDHQVLFAERLHEFGLLNLVADASELGARIEGLGSETKAGLEGGSSALVEKLAAQARDWGLG